jgi:hypothetical protein
VHTEFVRRHMIEAPPAGDSPRSNHHINLSHFHVSTYAMRDMVLHASPRHVTWTPIIILFRGNPPPARTSS